MHKIIIIKKKNSVNQRTVDGGVIVAAGLVFTDFTDVGVDEVRALLLLLLRMLLDVFVNLTVNEPVNQLQVGQDLLHFKRVAWDVLQNRDEVHDSGACIERSHSQSQVT